MARKLIFGNDIVSFVVNVTPTTRTGVLVINGNYPVEKILAIADSTSNRSLYTFADPTTIITCSQDYDTRQTTININSVPTQTSTGNKIEVFIEKEELEIKPSRTYRDPVSKLRVSQPESIIDTDFEYGLQPTKWETVRLVNNIPTYYSSIFEDEAIQASQISVQSQAGSVTLGENDKVVVTTDVPHNLVKGSLIEITGLSDIKYEGVYIVSDVSDTYTFSYKTSFVSGESLNNIQTIYTLIYPGSFYTGSGIDLADVQFQVGSASTLIVSTPNIHGIKDNTKVYLKQTRVSKSYEFESIPNSPNTSDVVGVGTTTLGTVINSNSITGRNAYYLQDPIIADDWIGKFEVHLPTSGFRTSDGTISYNLADNQIGDAELTPLTPGDVFTFYTPRDNGAVTLGSGSGTGSISGDATFKCLKVLSTNYSFNGNGSPSVGIVTFKFNSSSDGTSPQTILGAGSTTFGDHRIIKGLRITRIDRNGSGQTKVYYNLPAGKTFPFSKDDEVVFISNSTAVGGTNLRWSTFNDYTPTYYRAFPIISIDTATQTFIVGRDEFNVDLNARNDTNYPNLPFAMAVKIRRFDLNNTIQLKPTAGFSTDSFQNGDYVGLTTTGSGAALPLIVKKGTNVEYPALLSGGSTYRLKGGYYNLKFIDNRYGTNWYRLYAITDNPLATPYNIILPQGNVTSTFNTNTYTFKSTINRKDQHTIRLKNQSKFSNNQKFNYAARAGSTAIAPLSPTVYRAKSNENISGNKFRIGQVGFTSAPGLVYFYYPATGPTGNRNYARVDVRSTNVNTAGIVTGEYIQITGYSGPDPVKTAVNRIFKVNNGNTAIGGTNPIGISTVLASGYTTLVVKVEGINSGFNTFTNFSAAASAGNILPGTQVTGIVTFTDIGSGTQVASLDTPGVADDVYSATQTDSKSFTFNSNYTISEVTKSCVGGANTIGVSTVPAWIRLPQHLFADGTKVTYTANNPSTPIGELTDGSDYYVRVLDGNHIGLTLNADTAIDRNDLDSLINFSDVGAGNTHTFTSTSAKGFIIGNNPNNLGFDKVTFTDGSNIINGINGTTFLSDFSSGDLLRIYQLNSSVGPGTYFQSKIISVKSNSTLQIEDVITSDVLGISPSGIGTGNYFIPTRAYLLTDAKAGHRPFDGGVSMSPGITANSQIIRQTRRYFRYQSGKGIQVSMAVNFNPTYDIDNIAGIGSTARIFCKFPHGISKTYVPDLVNTQNNQKSRIYAYDRSKNSINSVFNGSFDIQSVVDDFTFDVNFNADVPTIDGIGFLQYNVLNWRDASLKAGMFDDQNGFFYKYDGATVYAVRRSSTQQLSGRCTVERNSHFVNGTGTFFVSQLAANENIIIRGQTYKVISVDSNTQIQVQPAYRGQDSSQIILSKVVDTEIPQSQWNLDRCDGTGPSGYNLNPNRIQMIYMDYSWYGAGSIRFGFKNQDGEVFYCHEFLHNNIFTESYFRSGNLPARYEVLTGDAPGFGPSLFHWGCSVVMDGRFDDDKAYLFTADSDALPYTNGGFANFGGTRPSGTTVIGSNKITGISGAEASSLVVGEIVTDAAIPTTFPTGTKITEIEIDQSSDANRFGNNYALTISNAATSAGSKNLQIFSGTSTQLKSFIPLVSIRLAPSVDNGSTGNLGFRDIITRMQLTLKSAGVLTTHDCEVRLYLNPRLSKDNWTSVGSPSLAQIYKHQIGDSFTGGIKIYSFRAQGGSVTSVTNGIVGKRTLNVNAVSLEELALLGNSILGGDGVYPDGPDVLTITVRPVDPSQITGASPFIVSSRITWAEAQA